MNENINLCEILKGHEGETFYSPVFCDNVQLLEIYESTVLDFKKNIHNFTIRGDGKLTPYADEIAIFPSKDQRDWNKWLEKQKSKVPKTWRELTECMTPSLFCEIFPKSDGTYITVSEDCGELPIEKSALALLKIHQLIEVGYGGNVTKEEWKDGEWEYIIVLDSRLRVTFTCGNRHAFAFHTREQAEEFLSKPENVELLKDYFMV